MPQQGPKNSATPASRPDFNTTRYAALARQFAENALAAKPNQAIIEQIFLTQQIERDKSMSGRPADEALAIVRLRQWSDERAQLRDGRVSCVTSE